MKKTPTSNIILSIVSFALLCSAFGGAAIAQAVSAPVTEASPGIGMYEILSIIASLVMVIYLAAPYFKKPDDKSKK